LHQVRRSVLLHISFSDVIVVVLEEAHTGIASGIEIIHEQRRFAKFCHSLLEGFCWILWLLDAVFLKLLIVQFFNRCSRAFIEIERRVEVVWKLCDSRHDLIRSKVVSGSLTELGDAIIGAIDVPSRKVALVVRFAKLKMVLAAKVDNK
jgi:hypothetical protein